ncbi:MAG: single-stranded DNA-binding protein [Clostridiales bacterium]|nr:single-stranded DNA-binding protein [Clostridiales bacterium]
MLNKVVLMGRLVRDPELRSTPNGVSVCSFTVAVDRRFVRQGEERQADFINCVAWRQTGEFVSKYFTKGRMINVVGSIQTRTWNDNEGKKRYATDIVADEINFCGDKRSENTGESQTSDSSNYEEPHNEGFMAIDADDDLPF